MTLGYFENLFEFDVICSNITRMNEDIELVAVLNNKGRAVEMIAKEDGINNELTTQKREMLFMESVLKSSMNKEHNYEFGDVRCSILEREKFTIFSFEILNYLLLVIARPSLDILELKNKITEILINNRKVELAQ